MSKQIMWMSQFTHPMRVFRADQCVGSRVFTVAFCYAFTSVANRQNWNRSWSHTDLHFRIESSSPLLQLQTVWEMCVFFVDLHESKLLTVKVTLCFVHIPGKQDQDLLCEMIYLSQAFLSQYSVNNDSLNDYSKQLLSAVILLILLFLCKLLLFWDSFQLDGLQMFPRRDSSVNFTPAQCCTRAWITLFWFFSWWDGAEGR